MSQSLTLPASFGNQKALTALDPNYKPGTTRFAQGIRSGFAVLGIKGKIWSITHGGVTNKLTRKNEDGVMEAVPSLNLILIDSGSGVSKVYYPDGYVDGSDAAPKCFSNDGVVPDAQAEEPQCSTCAMCPHNAWGSKISDNGKKTKACADSKRLAVVPLGHESLALEARVTVARNEKLGGPMLLRVPAASMGGLAEYANKMEGFDAPLHLIGTRVSFDINEAFPKVLFAPVRPLTAEEVAVVLEMQASAQVKDMLGLGNTPAPAQAAPAQAAPAQAAPAQAAPARRTRAAAATQAAPAAAAATVAAASASVPADPFGGETQAAPAQAAPATHESIDGEVLEADEGVDALLAGIL